MNLSCDNGRSVRLSQRECAVLELLMRSPQTVYSKSALLTRVGGTAGETGLNNVEAYISFLRKKFAFLGSEARIETLRKAGYRFMLPGEHAANG